MDWPVNTHRTTRTRLVMDKKICSVSTVCFIFTAALHLEAVVQRYSIYNPNRALTWEKARLHCQEKNGDLITMEDLKIVIPWWVMHPNLTLLPLWTGLVRHPEDATVWKEVSFK